MGKAEINLGGVKVEFGREPNILRPLKDYFKENLRVKINDHQPKNSTAEEETRVAGLEYNLEEKGHFAESDLRIIRMIMSYLFKQHDLPKENGVELGCGPKGLMVERYMQPYINEESWLQIDANRSLVEANRKAHPRSDIRQLNYSNLPTLGPKPFLVGVDALSQTFYLSKVLEQAVEALETRGYLLHILSGRASINNGAAWMQRNFKPPHKIAYVKGHEIAPFYYWNSETEKWVSGAEAFRQNIGVALADLPNMNVIRNEWIFARRDLVSGEFAWLEAMGVNLPLSIPERQVGIVLTLAQKLDPANKVQSTP